MRCSLLLVVALAIATGGCGAPSSTRREPWSSDDAPPRGAAPCETARLEDADGARTWDLDLDGDGSSERVVASAEEIMVIDHDCSEVRLRVAFPSFDARQRPSLAAAGWDAVTDDQLREWAATDVLGGVQTRELSTLSAGARSYIVLSTIGAPELRRAGYLATFLSCTPARCRTDQVAHVEWRAVPGAPCPRYRSPFENGRPLLEVEPQENGALVVRQRYADHADCAESPSYGTLRSAILDDEGLHDAPN